jgi:hypothetical protein
VERRREEAPCHSIEVREEASQSIDIKCGGIKVKCDGSDTQTTEAMLEVGSDSSKVVPTTAECSQSVKSRVLAERRRSRHSWKRPRSTREAASAEPPIADVHSCDTVLEK